MKTSFPGKHNQGFCYGQYGPNKIATDLEEITL
jgi:hypothetical protein